MELEYFILQTLELEQSSPSDRNMFAGGIISLIVFLTFASVIILKNKRKNGLLLVSIIAVASIVGCIYSIPIIADEASRLNGLRKDAKEQVIIESQGVVEDINTYVRGRSECFIKGDRYRFLNGVEDECGSIICGWNYKFTYLKNSKYIVDFEVVDEHILLDECWLKEDKPMISINRGDYSSTIFDFDDYAYDYAIAYYMSLNQLPEFREKLHTVSVYYRKDIDKYVAYFWSENDENIVYMMFNTETEMPVYFEDNLCG